MFASNHVFSFVKCIGMKGCLLGGFVIWRKQEMIFWAVLEQMGFFLPPPLAFERNRSQYCLGTDA